MSNEVYIIEGDFSPQIARFTQIGIYRKPALQLRVPVPVKRFWKKGLVYCPIEQTWPVKEKIRSVEKISDIAKATATDWDLPGRQNQGQGFWKSFSGFFKKSYAMPIHPRAYKQVRFKMVFQDGQSCVAIADARIFQNLHALLM